MAEECDRLMSRPRDPSTSFFFGFFASLVWYPKSGEWKHVVRFTSLTLRNTYIKSGLQRPQVLKWLSLHIKGIMLLKGPNQIVGLRFKEDSQCIIQQGLDRLPEIIQWSNALHEVFPFDDDFARGCDPQGYDARVFLLKAFMVARHRAYTGPLPSFDKLLQSVYFAAPPHIVTEYPGRLIASFCLSGMLPLWISFATALTRYIENPVTAGKPLVFCGMHGRLVAIFQSFFPDAPAEQQLPDLILGFSSTSVKFQAKMVRSGCWLLSVCHPDLSYALESHAVDANSTIRVNAAPQPRVTVSLDFSHRVADLLCMTDFEFFSKFPAIFAKEQNEQLNINLDFLMQFFPVVNARRVDLNRIRAQLNRSKK
jgi:hypothetical protein